MARRLTWQSIQAPQLDMRDTMLAGNQLTQSFDRLGQTLKDREARMRTEATNEALAGVHLAGTPEEIAALRAQGLGHLDRRVDRLAYAQSMGQVEGQIMDRRVKQNELTRFDAEQWAGQFAPELLTAAGKLDDAGYDRVMGAMMQDPKYADYAFATTGHIKDSQTLRGEADTRRQTGIRDENQAAYQRGTLANQARGIALQEEDVRLRREREQQIEDASQLGSYLGRQQQFLGMDPVQVARELETAPELRGMPTWAKQAAINAATGTHSTLTNYSEEELSELGDFGTGEFMRPLRVAANAAENRQITDLARYTRASQAFEGTRPQLIDNINDRGWATGRAEVQTAVDRMLRKNPHLNEGDIAAAADMSDFKPGAVDLFTGQHWRNLERAALRIADAREEGGYGQNEAEDVAAAREPFAQDTAAVQRVLRLDQRYAMQPHTMPEDWPEERQRILDEVDKRLMLNEDYSAERRRSRVR